MTLRFDRLGPYLPFLLNGIWPVIILSLVAAFFGCVIGFIAALAEKYSALISISFEEHQPLYSYISFIWHCRRY